MNNHSHVLSLFFNTLQLTPLRKLGCYTIGDLSQFMLDTPPKDFLMVHAISPNVVAMCLSILGDHDLDYSRDYSVWYEKHFMTTAAGKLWKEKQAHRKRTAKSEGTVYTYAKGGAPKSGRRNLSKHNADTKEERSVTAEMFMVRYYRNGFDAEEACQHFGIDPGKTRGGATHRKHLKVLEESGELPRIKEEAGINKGEVLDQVSTVMQEGLKAVKQEFKIVEVYRDQLEELRELVPHLSDGECERILNAKFFVDTYKVTTEVPDWSARTRVGDSFVKAFGAAEAAAGGKGGIIGGIESPQAAEAQMVDQIVRYVEYTKTEVVDLLQKVQAQISLRRAG